MSILAAPRRTAKRVLQDNYYLTAKAASSPNGLRSSSRDAVLLMNAPGYQCGADLVDPSGTWVTEAGGTWSRYAPGDHGQ
ncbi:hypothetical protein ACGFWD_39485 [Streptomyces sp. NPDC048448]|uniref:hypothetical protein n=1 Tax=Streptomyces sp. NPDC048448 TaxID=3365554 RepID=UPI0037149485